MLIALTGTPGVGKTSISNLLSNKGYEVIFLNELVNKKGIFIGIDKKRDSKIVNIEELNSFIKNNYSSKNYVIIDGHLSHHLKCIDKIIILRCHPNDLKKRLLKKGWNKEKIKENIEAEILDIIFCESIKNHKENNIFEINTTEKKIEHVTSEIVEIIENDFIENKKYKIGKIDWSEEIFKKF